MTLQWGQTIVIRNVLRIAGVFVCVWLLSSCATVPPPPVKAVAPAPVPVEPAQVAILLSQDIPNFIEIADGLGKRLGHDNYTVHHLQGKLHYGSRVMAEIDASGADQLVAIGLLAAKIGREQQSRPMVFCQTYNYQEHNLVSATSKGVSFLPPFDQQFDSWQKLSPDLRSIGVVTGPNQDALLKQIKQAASRKNIQIISRIVDSDKEALLEFRRLVPEIQGLLLLPDNRILSPGVLRQMMSIGAKRRTQIAVYSPNLLDLGALISFASKPPDIAKSVAARLQSIREDGTIPGPALQSLSQVDVHVNPAVAKHLSLVVPEQLVRLGHASKQGK